MKKTAAAIQPGTAALFVLVRRVTVDKLLERLKGEGGSVMKTSQPHQGGGAAGCASRHPGCGAGADVLTVCVAFD